MTKEKAALHEAAHGYVAHRLGWIVSEIRLEEIDGRVAGHTIAGPRELGDDAQSAKEGLLYAGAGTVAEAIHLGTRPRDAVRESIRQDARDGQAMAKHLRTLADARDWDSLLDVTADELENLLRENWNEVQRIAAAVLKDGVCHLRPADG